MKSKQIVSAASAVIATTLLMGGAGCERHIAPPPPPPQATAKKAVLTIDQATHNCTQSIGGNSEPIVHLSKNNKDTIQWSPPTATTHVRFANAAPLGPFPLVGYTGASSPVSPTGNQGPYYYTEMYVNGQKCSNYQTMGVHVDQ